MKDYELLRKIYPWERVEGVRKGLERLSEKMESYIPFEEIGLALLSMNRCSFGNAVKNLIDVCLLYLYALRWIDDVELTSGYLNPETGLTLLKMKMDFVIENVWEIFEEWKKKREDHITQIAAVYALYGIWGILLRFVEDMEKLNQDPEFAENIYEKMAISSFYILLANEEEAEEFRKFVWKGYSSLYPRELEERIKKAIPLERVEEVKEFVNTLMEPGEEEEPIEKLDHAPILHSLKKEGYRPNPHEEIRHLYSTIENLFHLPYEISAAVEFVKLYAALLYLAGKINKNEFEKAKEDVEFARRMIKERGRDFGGLYDVFKKVEFAMVSLPYFFFYRLFAGFARKGMMILMRRILHLLERIHKENLSLRFHISYGDVVLIYLAQVMDEYFIDTRISGYENPWEELKKECMEWKDEVRKAIKAIKEKGGEHA